MNTLIFHIITINFVETLSHHYFNLANNLSKNNKELQKNKIQGLKRHSLEGNTLNLKNRMRQNKSVRQIK